MKLFGGDDKDHPQKEFKKSKRLTVNFTKASSISAFPKPSPTLTMPGLAKSSSYSSYPQAPHQLTTSSSLSGSGSKAFKDSKARTLIRRESLDFSDLLNDEKYHQESRTHRRPSEEMRIRFNCYRTLPSISSWDIYGDDTVMVTFHKRMSMSVSPASIAEQLRAYAACYEEKRAPREKIRKEDAVYEVVGEKHPVISATKEKLLKLLVDPRSEPEYLHQYVETHLWHTTTGDLFTKLVEFYNPNMTSDDLTPVRLRVLRIVMHWLDHFPQDFKKDMNDTLMSFVEVVNKTGMPSRELADAIAGKRRPSAEPLTPINGGTLKPSKIPKKAGGESGKFQFLDFHPTEVARQLTLIEHSKFCEIKRAEFLRQAWNKKDGEGRSPNLVAFIKRFNQISYWVATEIVFTPNLKQRISLLKRMIQVANKCFEFNNFNTAMEIVAGLNLSSVQRLKKTWKGLPAKYTSMLQDITKALDSAGNYGHYRMLLATAEPPVIPYLGVFLRDLTFIEDGNADFVEDDRFLNFDKLRMLSNVLSAVAKYQRVKYNLEFVPVIKEYLQDAMFLDDAALHKYSHLCETSTGATAVATGMMTGTGLIGKSKRTSLGLFG